MKYVNQFCVILGFSLLGEALHALLPLPIPASIYGLLSLFAALAFRWVRVERIRETGAFLTGLLPLLFVSPVVNLMDCWAQVSPALLPILAVVVASTLITFGVSGRAAQALVDRRRKGVRHD